MKVGVVFDQVFFYTDGNHTVGRQGEIVEVPNDQAKRLIELGGAREVTKAEVAQGFITTPESEPEAVEAPVEPAV